MKSYIKTDKKNRGYAFEQVLSEFYKKPTFVKFFHRSSHTKISLSFFEKYRYLYKYVRDKNICIDNGVLVFIAHYVDGDEEKMNDTLNYLIQYSRMPETSNLISPNELDDWLILNLFLS